MLRGITGKLFLVIIQSIFCLSMVAAAQAATFNVDTTADEVDANPGDGLCLTASSHCSLRAAIQAANASAGTADTINVPAGTYTLSLTGIKEENAATGDLDITDSVTITGADRDTTIIDGNASDRVFQIMIGASVTLSNLTIQNGFVDGDSNVTSDGISGGGGIYNGGVLRIENCKIQQNTVINGADTGAGGGGLQTTGVAGTGPDTVKTILLRSIVSNNSAPLGGGVRNFFARTIIDLTEVDNNTASLSGGGIQNADGGMSITRSTVRNNTAQQTGGGVDNLAALDIGQSSIYDNQVIGINPGAGGAGGGIYNGAAGALELFNSTVSGNNAVKAGGGIYNHKELTATNSTIYDNSVIDAGGTPIANGTEVFACGTGTTENPATCNSGITDSSGNLLIHTKFINSIVGNSSTTNNCNGDVADLITSQGHNIETGTTCGFTASGDMTGVSSASLFAAESLKYNGGDLASLLSIALPGSSPARDNGDNTYCTATDQRGFLRDSLCDIGAYEFAAVANSGANVLDLALDISDKIAAPLNGTVQVTITFSVANKGPLQGTNVVLTGSIPGLSWLNVTSLGSGSSAGSCSQTSTGFTCTILSIDAYDSADFFVAVLATSAGSFNISGEVKSDEVDNYRPDNLKSVKIDIPTVAGSSVSGNNFAGSSGGGTMDWLSLLVLFPVVSRRLQRRNRPG